MIDTLKKVIETIKSDMTTYGEVITDFNNDYSWHQEEFGNPGTVFITEDATLAYATIASYELDKSVEDLYNSVNEQFYYSRSI